MNRERIIIFLWGCVTVVFISMFVASSFLETVKIWKLSNGSTISLELGGLGEICFIVAVYYITKLLLIRRLRDAKEDD